MQFLSLILLIGWPITGWGQLSRNRPTLPIDSNRHIPHVLLKFSPLSLIDIDATLQGAVEVRTSRRTSVQGEFGYGWPGFAPVGWSKPGENYSQKEVWRGRLEARLYRNLLRPPRRPNRGPTTFPLGRYWAVEGVYKQINVLESRQIAVGCLTGTCPPGDIFIRPATRQAVAAHLKAGWQWPIGRTDKGWSRLLIDSYVGVGARLIWVTRPTPFPAGTSPLQARPADGIPSFGYGYDPGSGEVNPSVSLGVKVSYLL